MSEGVRSAVAVGSLLTALLAFAPKSESQVYGYTDDNGVLILSNVPTTDRMRLIVDDTSQAAGSSWQYRGQYDPLILKASNLFGVDSSLVRAVIAVESAFNRYARSHKGARGLMQLMPETGRHYGLVNAYDPWQNIRAGTAHLRDLMDEFKDLRVALAAYNAGPTPVRRHGGIPPYAETRNYVRKVMAIYGAGAKIEIVKGNRVYSIGQPGGRTQVVTSETPAGGSTLAELARRSAAARKVPMVTAASEPRGLADPMPPVQPDAALDVYYRYVDPEGTVFITRSRPATFPYEVLQP